MTKQIEVIKAQGNIRRRNGKIEVAQRRVAAYCRVSTDSEDLRFSIIGTIFQKIRIGNLLIFMRMKQ